MFFIVIKEGLPVDIISDTGLDEQGKVLAAKLREGSEVKYANSIQELEVILRQCLPAAKSDEPIELVPDPRRVKEIKDAFSKFVQDFKDTFKDAKKK